MQTFLGRTESISEMITLIRKSLLRDLRKAFPDVDYLSSEDLIGVLLDICTQTSESFIFIIDEWDCIFREHKSDYDSQKAYLDFIRGLLKDQSYVALAYMTGILPVKNMALIRP